MQKTLPEYKYQPSVLAIKKHSEQEKCFYFSEVNTTDILKLINSINISKVIGEDQISPKLIETGDNFLVKPLTSIINPSFSRSTFLNLAKRVSAAPVYKGDT